MSNFVEVTESRYGSDIFLNIDNIVVVDRNVVHTNTVHGEGTGMFHFDEKNLAKILKAIKESTPKPKQPKRRHR